MIQRSNCGQEIVDGIATRYGLEDPRIESHCRRDFPCHAERVFLEDKVAEA
jgi:hypothetical protein